MDDQTQHTQFLALSSSPLIQHNGSNYTSYNLQTPYTPTLLLRFFFHPPILHPKPCPDTHDPRSFTFDPTRVRPMHKPLSEPAPSQFTAFLPLPVVPAACPTDFVNSVSHPHSHKHKTNATHRLLTISPSLHPYPGRDQRASATVTRAFPVALPPARAVQIQTCTAGSSGLQSAGSPKIRTAALVLLVLLMALDVLGHADPRIHMDHRCVSTQVFFHPLWMSPTNLPWLQTWVPKI